MFNIGAIPISGATNNPIYESVSVSTSLTDTLSRTVDFARTITDTLSFTDSASKNMVYNFSISSNLLFSQNNPITADYLKDVTDTLVLMDVAAPSKFFDVFDTLSFSDALYRIDLEDLSATDSLEFGHELLLNQERFDTFTHTLSFSDQVTIPTFMWSNDFLDLTDIVNIVTNPGFVIVHNLGLTQDVSYHLTPGEFITISDSLNFGDVVVLNTFRSQNYTDSLHFTDSVVASLFKQRAITDNFTLTQSLSFSLFEQQDIVDTLNFTQSVTVAGLIDPQAIDDVIGFNEVITYEILPAGRITQHVTFSQAVTYAFDKYFEICHCINFDQHVGKGILIDVSDTLTFVDSIDYKGLIQYLTQTIGIYDVLVTNIIEADCCRGAYVPDKTITQSISFSDSVTLQQVYGTISIVQSLSFHDSVAYIGPE